MYLDDYNLSATIDFKFTTRKSTGLPTQLAGSPAVSVYKTNSTMQTTTGVTLTVDFDSITGLNHVRIDTSADGTFYAAGCDFAVVITAGTVDSISVVGETVATFSILNRSALRPTTAGRTLDVSAAGNAGIDWSNIEAPTTTLNLSGTTVKTVTDVEADTQDIQSRLPAALTAGGNMKSDALAINAISTSGVTTVSAYIGSTGAAVNGTNVNTLAGHDPGATLGTSTLTQAQVTGGAYALNSASFAFNAALDFTTTQKAATLARVTLVDTTAANTDMITQASVRSAVGLASANLDTQIATLATASALSSVASALTTAAANVVTILGKFTGITLLAQWLGAMAGKQTPNSTALTEINATGAGSGTYSAITDSQEALRDNYTTGGDTLVVAPVVATVVGNNIVSSGTTQAFRYRPLPTGPITVVNSAGTAINLSAAAVTLRCVNTTDPTDTWTLTEATGLSVGGASNNAVSIDYVPTFYGKYKWWLDYQPSGETDWTLGGFGFFDIGDAPDPR